MEKMTGQNNFDFEEVESQLKKSEDILKIVKKKVHDEFVRIVREYGEKINSEIVLKTGGLIICGDWKCVTYLTKLKLIDDCYLRNDIVYSAPGGSGHFENEDFEIRYDINDRIFFLKQLTDFLQNQQKN